MWCWKILTSPLVPNNERDRAAALADRIADVRPLWLAGRFAAWTAALVALALTLSGVPVSWSLAVVMIAPGLIAEAAYSSFLLAESLGALERRLTITGLAFAAWAAGASYLLGGVEFWGGPIAPVLALVGMLPLLQRRQALTVTLAVIGAYAATIAADITGALPSPDGLMAMTMTEPLAQGPQIAAAVASVLLLPVVALLMYAFGHRLRETRHAARQRAAALQAELDEVHAEVQRHGLVTAELTRQREALEERNRHLAVINAVSFALSEPFNEEEAFERAVRLVARLLDLRLAQVYVLAREDERARHVVGTADDGDRNAVWLPASWLRRVAESGRAWFSRDQHDPEPATLMDDEEYAIVPLQTRGGIVGSFAVKGPRLTHWSETDRQLVLLVARELASAVENHRLYTAAVERAGREAVLNDFARALSADVGRDAVQAALPIIAAYVSAPRIALVSIADDADGSHEISALWSVFDEGASSEVTGALLEAVDAASASSDVVVLGEGNDLPMPAAGQRMGVTSGVVAHVMAAGRRAAALVALGDADRRRWTASQLDVLRQATDALAQHMESEALIRLQSRRIRELSGLSEIAEVVQSTVDIERLLTGFAAALHSLVRYRGLYVARLDIDGRIADVHRFGEDGRPFLERVSVIEPAAREHPWFHTRGPIVWRAGDPDVPPPFVASDERYALVVPLRAKSQLLGLAVLTSSAPPADDARTIAEQALGQLSLALDAAELYRQATEHAARIQVQGNLARIVASVVDLREAFDAFSEEVRWLIPFDRTAMLLIDHGRQVVNIHAMYPEPGPAREFPLAGSLPEAVLTANGPVVIDHMRGTSTAGVHERIDWSRHRPGNDQIALVPIHRGALCVGVLALVSEGNNAYTEQDVAALEEVSRLLAVSIEREDLFRQAEHAARHDLLTDLPNYRYFQERQRQIEPRLAETGAAVLVVDLDNLKVFNDVLGHSAGDQVLQLVARELRACCRAEDFVARTGGDEFVVLIEGGDYEVAHGVAQRIHAELEGAHLEIKDAPGPIRLSIGVAVGPHDGLTVQALLEAADHAMYEAKFSGGGRTASGTDHAHDRVSRVLRYRPNRMVEALIRAAADGANAAEREALALAQRYAVTLAVRGGLREAAVPSLRIFVAAEAIGRLGAPERTADRETALMLVRGLHDTWREQSPDDLAAVESLVPASVELAWLLSGAERGEPLAVDDALERLRERAGALGAAPSVVEALAEILLGEEIRRRRGAVATPAA